MARRLSLTLLLAVMAAACAADPDPTLDTASVVEALPAVVWPDDPSLVTEVSCRDLDPEVIAQSVRCTAQLDAEPITVDVDVTEDGGVDGRVVEPLFAVADAADQLAARLADDLGIEPPEIACGRDVVIARAGTEFGCTATRAGDPIDFVLRLLDSEGGWTVEIALS